MNDQHNEQAAAASNPQNSAEPSPQFGTADTRHYQQQQQKTNKVLWGIFALLLVLAVGVFFILPGMVGKPDVASSQVVVVKPAATAAQSDSGISPFEEAQRLRQREAAQNTLAALLELQEALEKKAVIEWAADAFNRALTFAQEGDLAYRQQQFIEAERLYAQGLAGLQAINAQESATYNSQLERGEMALVSGDADTADNAFSLALLINPDSEQAVIGMERAVVLNDVLAYLAAGETLQQQDQLQEAREQYRQASAIDAELPAVKTALSQINTAILERDYTAAMSRGYAALQQGSPEEATTAFNQALKLKPNAQDVASALQQAADAKSTTIITRHMNAALAFEAEENWALALSEWQAALAEDPNLVAAEQGLRRSTSRNNLDQFLSGLIATPLQLADDALFNQASQVISDTGRITNHGPKLKAQVTQVRHFLEQIKIPVTVQFNSDGMTAVTVYRIGELGTFTKHSLQLTPGNYIAVGVRTGYRDVRQEFTVGIDSPPPQLTVTCTETI